MSIMLYNAVSMMDIFYRYETNWYSLYMNKESSNSSSSPTSQMLNKLRAAVLGANDGIVSTAAVIMGVAGATSDTGAIFTAGLAALVAGALSMAVGEYVSVSSQSDAEKAFIEREKNLLETDPAGQLEELTQSFVDKGINPETARQVASEFTKTDPLKAHLIAEFGLDEEDVVNPLHAAVASLAAFTVGGLIPFVAILAAPVETRLWVTGGAVIVALALTGYMSASVGGASRRNAIIRVLIGGVAAMVITYFVGHFFGTAIG